ncbi:MAG: type IV pilus assembly protein PilM [Candidatus Paceibacterota bacterium]|jgi:type IV pilus assembly protein PilM
MANPISDIFGSFFAPKDTKVLGIDIGSSSVKVVQLKKQGGKAVLETYGEIALGPYSGTDLGRATVLSADKLGEAVKDLLKESNTTTLNSGLSISIGSSFIVFIKMPTSEEKNFAEMVPIEARKYIPVPISEVTLDWWAIPKDENTVSEFQNGQKVEGDKSTEVLLIVINNDALNKNRDIQKLAELATTFSEVEIFSCMRASLEPSIEPQVIMDLGAGSTKVFIVEKGILRASHVVNRGSQDITLSISKSMGLSFEEAEKIKIKQGIVGDGKDNISEISSITVDYILSETGRFIMNYYKKSGKKISKVVLTGGGSLLRGLKEKAQNSFETPVEIADPFSKVEYPAFLEEVLKTAGPEFAVAIGLAIRKLQEI